MRYDSPTGSSSKRKYPNVEVRALIGCVKDPPEICTDTFAKPLPFATVILPLIEAFAAVGTNLMKSTDSRSD